MVLHNLDAPGGAEQQAWRLSRTLRNRSIKVEMVTGSWNGEPVGSKLVDGIPIHFIPTAGHLVTRRGGRRISRYVMLIALFRFLWQRRNQYDILHFHESDFLAVAGVIIGRLFGKRVITKMRTSGAYSDVQRVLAHWRGPEKPIIIGMLRRADRTITLNEESIDELLSRGFRSERLVAMVNGIDARQFTPRSDYALRRPPAVIFVGRLEDQKDAPTLLRALTLLDRSDVRAIILGDGPQRDSYERLTDELGLRERVDFCGRVSDVKPYLQQADVFVLPSFSEGISNALLEAMSCGLPCVVSDIAGNRAVVSDDADGQLYEPGNAEALASQLSCLLSDESLRRQIGRAARETIVRRFSMERVADAYVALYEQLVDQYLYANPVELME